MPSSTPALGGPPVAPVRSGLRAEEMTSECSGGTQGRRSMPSMRGSDSDSAMSPASVSLPHRRATLPGASL